MLRASRAAYNRLALVRSPASVAGAVVAVPRKVLAMDMKDIISGRRSAGNAGMARGARFGARAGRSRARAFSARSAWSRKRAAPAPTSRSTRPPRTSTPSRLRAKSARRATQSSSTRSARSCAGTRWRWWCARTRNRPSSAATSRASLPPPRSTTSASIISFRAANEKFGGDLVYFQGHSAPGVYARAFLEGRITEEQLGPLPPGSRRQGTVVVSASVADARFLAVPDGVDGARAR